MKSILCFCLSIFCVSLLTSCQTVDRFVYGDRAARLKEMDDFPSFSEVPNAAEEEKARVRTANSQVLLLNSQVKRYNGLIGEVNMHFSNLDGRRRKASLFSLGGRSFLGATSVASAVLTSTAPAANARWIQGFTATGAAYNSFEAELNTQQVSAIAVRESLQLTANDLISALNGLRFFEAYEAIVNGGDFRSQYNQNRKAFSAIEAAIVLKPFTHVVNVTSTAASTSNPNPKPEAAPARTQDELKPQVEGEVETATDPST